MRRIHILIVRGAAALFLLLLAPFLLINRVDFIRGKKRSPFYKSKITALLERHPFAYDVSTFLWNYPMGARVYRLLPPVAGTVLQVGCGTGLLNRYLGSGGEAGVRMVNLDINGDSLRYARGKGRLQTCVNATVHRIPVKSGVLDAVVFPRCFHHIRSPAKALKECARVLKTRGVVVITDPLGLHPREARGAVMVHSAIDGLIWRYGPEAFKNHIEKNRPPDLTLRLSRCTRQINVSNYNPMYPHTDSLVVLEKA